MCKVRYAGPTSHPRDHRMYEIAGGVKHIWLASVVAGLAVVLTGSIAYTAVQAETAPKVRNLNEAVAAMWRKLDVIDANVKAIRSDIEHGGTMPHASSTNMMQGQSPTANLSSEAKACIMTCQTTWKSCQAAAGDNKDSREACTKTGLTCLAACLPSGAPLPPLTTPPPQGGQGSGDHPQGPPQGDQHTGDDHTTSTPGTL